MAPSPSPVGSHITPVQNWFEELRRPGADGLTGCPLSGPCTNAGHRWCFQALRQSVTRGNAQLPNDPALDERRTQSLDPSSIDTKIGVAESRCGADGDDVVSWPELQLEVIDKAEEGAPALCTQVRWLLIDDARPREVEDDLSGRIPGFASRRREPQRVHLMSRIACVTGDTVR